MSDPHSVEYDDTSDSDALSAASQRLKSFDFDFGKYNPEFLTTSLISGIKLSIDSIKESYNSLVQMPSDELDSYDKINNAIDLPDMINVTFDDDVISLASTNLPGNFSSYSSNTATVKANRLNFRSAPSTKSSTVGSFNNGDKIHVLEGDNGSGWTKVEDEHGNVGYVATKYLNIDNIYKESISSDPGEETTVKTNKGNDILINQINKGDSNNNNNTKPQFSPNTELVVNVKLNSSLRVRSSAGGNQISSLKAGETVTVLEQKDNWLKVKLPDNSEGWIYSGYVEEKK